MAHRKRFVRGGKQVRETSWLSIPEGRDTMVAANTAILAASLGPVALAMRPFTIVRTLLYFHTRSDQSAATENADVAIGMCVVSDQAAAIGVTAVPTPFTDLGSDLWYMHRILSSHFQFISGTGFGLEDGSQVQIDSRAMRKVNDDQDVILVLENSALSDGSTTFSAGRFLIKLH